MVDFTGMSHDEFADAGKAWVDELHRRVREHIPDSTFKAAMERRVEHVHRAMDFAKEHAVNGGLIRPYSGGDPKPPSGP